MSSTVNSMSVTRSGAWGCVVLTVSKVDMDKLNDEDAEFLNELFALLDIQMTFEAAHQHDWIDGDPIIRSPGRETQVRECTYCGSSSTTLTERGGWLPMSENAGNSILRGKTDFVDGDDVLVSHPYFGSVWLSKAYHSGELVVGEAWERGSGWNMPEDYSGEWTTMNFPLTCIRKVEHRGT